MTASVCFVDTETISLTPDADVIWEVGLIVDDIEHHWYLPVDLGKADPVALDIGRYYQRHPMARPSWKRSEVADPEAFAFEFSQLTAKRHLVGAVVSFDEERLRKMLRTNGACPSWHHRLICVETLAAGKLGIEVPLGLAKTAAELGVPVVEDDAHTALGDARLAKQVYEAVMGRSSLNRRATIDPRGLYRCCVEAWERAGDLRVAQPEGTVIMCNDCNCEMILDRGVWRLFLSDETAATEGHTPKKTGSVPSGEIPKEAP